MFFLLYVMVNKSRTGWEGECSRKSSYAGIMTGYSAAAQLLQCFGTGSPGEMFNSGGIQGDGTTALSQVHASGLAKLEILTEENKRSS